MTEKKLAVPLIVCNPTQEFPEHGDFLTIGKADSRYLRYMDN